MSQSSLPRSPVLSLHASTACNNPLVSDVGVQILRCGGNAADAAVAMAAALNVTQPSCTGIGGDCFCLFYDSESKRVKGLNGSGRSSSRLTLELLAVEGITEQSGLQPTSIHTVTVPGAAAGWVDTVNTFGRGKVSLEQILQPAIELAENGFPVSSNAAEKWATGLNSVLNHKYNPGAQDILLNGTAPEEGDVMTMPKLAETFKLLAQYGKDGFYKGRVAEAIVDVVKQNGGTLSTQDLAQHTSTFCQPISTTYADLNVWEMPPNGQGITVLIALNILEKFPIRDFSHNSVEYVHVVCEALRLAFADSCKYCADPEHADVPIDKLLSKEYAEIRKHCISLEKCAVFQFPGSLPSGSDTVYLTAVDQLGNACSFINSNFQLFGSGFIPRDCGFALHNRGLNFNLTPGHKNCVAPSKRPYNTIIPGMVTNPNTGDLYASFGVMGGFMQPQGHIQVLLNMIEFGMNPQEALDAPRFQIEVTNLDKVVGNTVLLEQGFPETVGKGLEKLGYNVKYDVPISNFGRGQIIQRRPVDNGKGHVYWAGSDTRGDGIPIGF